MIKLLSSLLVAFVTSVTVQSVVAQEIKGNAQQGAGKVAMCMGCHGIPGYQASFPEVHKVPKIAGQNAKYIASALNAYKAGDRKHPSMRGIADSLTEQDVADAAAFFEEQGKHGKAVEVPAQPREASPKVAELLKKGNCESCHGKNLNTPIDPAYPKIAGQYSDYLFVALKSYKAEGHSTWGRSNGVMAGIAKQFSNSELKEISKYLQSLPGEVKTVPEPRFR